MATDPKILSSLKADLALEHGAIIQYVVHGVQLRDAAITDPVRKTAREEMWHFEWLSEAIRDRGGEPVLDRAEVFLSTSMIDSMTEDVATEERALAHYAQTSKLVGDTDPELTHLIERIMADERSHRSSFERLAAQVRAGGEPAYAAHPLMGPEDLAVVGPTIAVEYMTLLQYLWNKYGCGDCEKGEEYFELAVDEMRHLSWVASYVPGLMEPRPPDVPADSVRFVGSTAEAHELARAMEERAGAFYAAKTAEATEPALARDLARAAGQHEYHRYLIGLDG